MGNSRSFLIGVLLTFFLFLSYLTSVQAADDAQYWVCLSKVLCASDTNTCNTTVDLGHKALVSVGANKPLANKDTYVIECVDIGTREMCTTGDENLDKIVYKNASDLSDLKKTYQYVRSEVAYQSDGKLFTYSQPFKTDSSGNINPFVWHSATSTTTGHRFFAMNFYDPKSNDISAVPGGQSVTAFNFEAAANDPDCKSISWDPDGIVFDSYTLQPVDGAMVQLEALDPVKNTFAPYYKYNSANKNITAIDQEKELDGVYRFYVPAGTYRLQVTKSGYTFPSDSQKISQKAVNLYTKAYPKIYPSQTGASIVEKEGNLEERNIPLDPVTVPSTTAVKTTSIALLGTGSFVSKNTGEVIINGKVNKPYAKIYGYSKNVTSNARATCLVPSTNAETDTSSPCSFVRANYKGEFELVIDQKKIPTGEVWGELVYQKELDIPAYISKKFLITKDTHNPVEQIIASVSNFFSRYFAVEAATKTSASFEPIPTFLEGIAYDSKKEVIPNATVGVYLQNSDNPYYQTKADVNGHYKITSEFLPSMPYKIRYTSPSGSSVTVSTSQYVSQNQTYTQANKVNIYQYQNAKGGTASPNDKKTSTSSTSSAQKSGNGTYAPGTKTNAASVSNDRTANTTGTVSNNSQASIIVVFILIVLLIAFAGIFLAFFILKKRSEGADRTI
ncbi:hypothetical protein HGA88_06095 [Candidatus Roizmanbacteria bacterium]|nr:hypothetical protein [Candidatus Roizmanbacteria bacterium]